VRCSSPFTTHRSPVTDYALPHDRQPLCSTSDAYHVRRRVTVDDRFRGVHDPAPKLIREWNLNNFEAGAISGIFFAGYMVGVPVLTSLTDHMDSRRIYVGACLISTVGAGGLTFASPQPPPGTLRASHDATDAFKFARSASVMPEGSKR